MNFDRCVAMKYFDAAIAIHGNWFPANPRYALPAGMTRSFVAYYIATKWQYKTKI